MSQVRVDCQPVQLWVALKAIHMEAARMRHRAQKLRNVARQRAIWEELRAAKVSLPLPTKSLPCFPVRCCVAAMLRLCCTARVLPDWAASSGRCDMPA